MNIFTTFGDLTPSEMLTLFLQFIHLPGYERSPFLAAMESSLMRMEVTTEVIEEAFTEKDRQEKAGEESPPKETI